MLGDIEDQRCFAHRRSRSDQYEIRVLEACRPVVQICKAGGKTGDVSFDMARVLDLLDGIDHDLADRHKAVGVPSLRDLKDPLLRVVHDHFQVVFLRITRSRYFLIGADHSAQQRFFRDDLRVGPDIGGGGHLLDQFQYHSGAINFRRKVLLPQAALQSHRIYCDPVPVHFQNGREKHAILTGIEILLLEHLRGGFDRLCIHQHCAYYGLFRLYTVGHHPPDRIFFCHITLPVRLH